MAGVDATIETIEDLENTIVVGIEIGFAIAKGKGFSLEAGLKMVECAKHVIDLAVDLKPVFTEVMDLDTTEVGLIAKRLAQLGINVYKKVKP